jgi:hypothetical protein
LKPQYDETLSNLRSIGKAVLFDGDKTCDESAYNISE